MPALTRTVRGVKDRPNDRAAERGYGAYADGVVYQVWSYEKPRDGEDLDYFAQYFIYDWSSHEAREWRAVKLGGFDGRHYPFKSARSRGDELSFYVYLARRHAYVVAAHGADERNASVRRFFQSFSLSDAPAGVPIVDDLPTGFEQFTGARANVPTGDAGPMMGGRPDVVGRGEGASPSPPPRPRRSITRAPSR